MNLNDLEQAESYQHQSLKLRREIDETRGIVISLNHLGQISLLFEDISSAKDFFQQSLLMVEQGHDKRNVVNSLLGLAQVHVVQEDL